MCFNYVHSDTKSSQFKYLNILFINNYSGDQAGKDQMCGACDTYGEEARCIQDFGGETCGNENNSEDLRIDAMILKWISKKWDGEA